jgi:hypothetical protein
VAKAKLFLFKQDMVTQLHVYNIEENDHEVLDSVVQTKEKGFSSDLVRK